MLFPHVFPPSHPPDLPKFHLFFKAKVKSFLIEVIPDYLHPSVIFSSLNSFSTSLFIHSLTENCVNIIKYVMFFDIDCVTCFIHLVLVVRICIVISGRSGNTQ